MRTYSENKNDPIDTRGTGADFLFLAGVVVAIVCVMVGLSALFN